MKAKSYCIAFGCLNNDKDKSLTFFSLPSNIERREKWLSLVDRPDLLPKAADLRRKTYLVCSAHFDDSSIKIIKHLKDDAVPTMFLPKQSKKGESSYSEEESISPQTKSEVTTLLHKIKTEPMEEEPININNSKNITELKQKLAIPTKILPNPSLECVGSSCSETQTISPHSKPEVTTLLHKVKTEPMEEEPININNSKNIVQITQNPAVPTMVLPNPSLLTEGVGLSCSAAQATSPQTKPEETTLLNNDKKESMEEPIIYVNTLKYLKVQRKRRLLSVLRKYKLKRQRLDKKIMKIKKELGVIHE